jgi:hypothetical protein
MIRSAVRGVVVGMLMGCATAGAQLYEGARLIPGDGGPAIESSSFLVEKGQRVNLAGKTVMPTIISSHVHPGFQKGLTYSAENYTREVILNDLNLAWYYGISVVMSQGIERAAQLAGELFVAYLDGQIAALDALRHHH